jgi:hypothetical protein
MKKNSNLIKRITGVAASALAITAITPQAFAQDKTDAAPVQQTQTDTSTLEKQLFTILPGLNASDTIETLAQLDKDPKTAKLLAVLSTKLSANNAKAKDIESDVLALIKGQKPEKAQLILDAIIRDYYNHYVVGHTGNKAAQAVAQEIIKRDVTLSDAAFGKLSSNRDPRRAVRAKRRRV